MRRAIAVALALGPVVGCNAIFGVSGGTLDPTIVGAGGASAGAGANAGNAGTGASAGKAASSGAGGSSGAGTGGSGIAGTGGSGGSGAGGSSGSGGSGGSGGSSGSSGSGGSGGSGGDGGNGGSGGMTSSAMSCGWAVTPAAPTLLTMVPGGVGTNVVVERYSNEGARVFVVTQPLQGGGGQGPGGGPQGPGGGGPGPGGAGPGPGGFGGASGSGGQSFGPGGAGGGPGGPLGTMTLYTVSKNDVKMPLTAAPGSYPLATARYSGGVAVLTSRPSGGELEIDLVQIPDLESAPTMLKSSGAFTLSTGTSARHAQLTHQGDTWFFAFEASGGATNDSRVIYGTFTAAGKSATVVVDSQPGNGLQLVSLVRAGNESYVFTNDVSQKKGFVQYRIDDGSGTVAKVTTFDGSQALFTAREAPLGQTFSLLQIDDTSSGGPVRIGALPLGDLLAIDPTQVAPLDPSAVQIGKIPKSDFIWHESPTHTAQTVSFGPEFFDPGTLSLFVTEGAAGARVLSALGPTTNTTTLAEVHGAAVEYFELAGNANMLAVWLEQTTHPDDPQPIYYREIVCKPAP